MIWIKPFLITFVPLFLVIFAWFRSEKWRKRNLTMLLASFWFGSVIPTFYVVLVAAIIAPNKNELNISKTYGDISELPILTTWYDPELGGINCAEPCNQYANGEIVNEDHYLDGPNQTAACIPEWLGASVTIPGLGSFKCRDTGGAIIVTHNEYYQRAVIHVDVLAHPGQMNHNVYLYEDWRIEW